MKLVQKRSRKTGLPPGTLVHIGEKKTDKVTITAFNYAGTRCDERQDLSLDVLAPPTDESVTWVDVGGVHMMDILESFGKQFQLHPLLLEDIANTDQRPKLDDYETCLFLVMKMLSVTDRQDIVVEQVSFVLGRNFVLSFQENGTDVFSPVRDRLRGNKGRLRQSGADSLLYALIDAIVDQYFAVLEVLGEKIEALQDLVVSDPKPETLRQVHALKRQLLFLRRAVWPLREATNNLSRSECPFLQESTKVFFRDVYDHVVQIVDTIETLREMVSASLDIYLSSISYRLNAVMKVLTIITTIFMPLTFIVGIYGMNFEHMPELKWDWGYPLVLGVMVAIAIAMLGFSNARSGSNSLVRIIHEGFYCNCEYAATTIPATRCWSHGRDEGLSEVIVSLTWSLVNGPIFRQSAPQHHIKGGSDEETTVSHRHDGRAGVWRDSCGSPW
jgi:magnesium transporter